MNMMTSKNLMITGMIVLVLVLASSAYSQTQKVFSINCPVSFDENNFFEIRARAGYEDDVGRINCDDLNVKAFINGKEYLLNKFVNCEYSKFVQLPEGEYEMLVTAFFPDGSETLSCNVTVPKTVTPQMEVYSPQALSNFVKGDVVYLEAAVFLNGENLKGNLSVYLNESFLTVLPINKDGTYSGTIKLEAEPGDYFLNFVFENEDYYLEKEVPITIILSNESAQGIGSGTIEVLIPENEQEFPKNSTISFEIKAKDINGLIIQHANATISLSLNGEKVLEEPMEEQTYTYRKDLTITKAGKYYVSFTVEKGEYQLTKTMVILVGNESQRAETANFSVRILVPFSKVYAVNSVLILRARTTLNSQPIRQAKVSFYFDGEKLNATYDSNGEFIASSPELTEGNHSFKVVAEYDQMLAEDYVEFIASSKVLNILMISPKENQTMYLKKGNWFEVKADVLDESNDTVPGAVVKAYVQEPSGRQIELSLTQDPDTGVYSARFYPNDDGKYSMLVSAELDYYVPAEKTLNFDVVLKEEKLQIGTNQLLLALLILGIIFISIALLKILV